MRLPLDPVWAIEPMAWRQILASIEAHEGIEERIAVTETSPVMSIIDGIATIHISGVLERRPSLVSLFLGGTSTEAIAQAAQDAAADSKIGSIVLLVDSPGGSVAGLAEAGDALWAARQEKPVIAHVSGMAASAAYYLAAQADAIYAQRMDLIGSIGARLLLYDLHELFAKAGIEAVPIDTGPYKSAGAPGTEITEDQRAYFQSLIDAYFNDMMAAIVRGRDLPRETIAADGRVFPALEALQRGLIDGVNSDFSLTVKFARDAAKQRARAEKLEIDEQRRVPSKTQSVICSKDRFDSSEAARKWVVDHGFKGDKIDETEQSYRFRQFPPGQCGSEPRTIKLDTGVSAVICRTGNRAEGDWEDVDCGLDIPADCISFNPGSFLETLAEHAGLPADSLQQEAIMPDDRKPATLEDLLACLGGIDAQRDASFIVEQQRAGATLDQARSAWEEETVRQREESERRAAEAEERARAAEAAAEAKAKKPGVEPLGTGNASPIAGDGNPRAEWEELIREEMKLGRSRPDAVRTVARRNPELRQRLIDDANSGRLRKSS